METTLATPSLVSGPVLRVLVVEDYPDQARLYTRYLEGDPFVSCLVSAVGTGREAIERCRADPPDCLLLDYFLPDLNALQVLPDLVDADGNPLVPVVVITGRGDEARARASIEAGAQDYVSKERLTPEVLRTSVHGAVQRFRLLREIGRQRQALAAEVAREQAERRAAEEADRSRQESEARLRLLVEVGAILGEALSDETALDRVGRLVAPSFADWFAVALIVDDEMVVCPSIVHRDAEKLALAWRVVGSGPRPIREHLLVGRALNERRSVLLPDLTEEMLKIAARDERQLGWLRDLGLRSVLVAPLLARDRLLGGLYLAQGESGRRFRAEDVSLAEDLARRVALAVDNARLLGAERAARDEADQRARQLDDMLHFVSHELRSPLTVIKGRLQLAEIRLAQLLSNSGLASPGEIRTQIAETAGHLEHGEAQVQRLDRLIGDLLDASRTDLGQLTLQIAQVDLAEIVRSAVAEQRATWPNRALVVRGAEAERTVRVRADPDRLGQVLANLLSNALKYSPANQPVTVTLSTEGDRARVAVHDEGPGLTPEQQASLWTRYRRVPGIVVQDASGASGGLGVGLYLSRTIVERQGGEVGIESARGAGSTFWFSLSLI